MTKKGKKGFCFLICFLIIGIVCHRIYEKSFFQVDKFIKSEQAKQRQIEEVKYQVVSSKPIDRKDFEGWEVILGSNDAKDLVWFEGKYYLATSGGLKVYTRDFKEYLRITNLDGLAENDITSLAVFDSKLYLGLKSKGLMVLYKNTLTHYLFENSNANKITSLLLAKSHLNIGSWGAGVIRFDSKGFTHLKGTDRYVTSMSLLNGDLAVGTQKNGLYILKRNKFVNITKKDGLLSDRINSLNCFDNRLFVGTPRGLNEVDEELKVSAKTRKQFVTSFALFNNKSYLGTFNGIFTSGKNIGGKLKINSLEVVNGTLFALTSEGLIVLREGKWEDVDKPGNVELSDNHITAIAFDVKGNLIIGTFDSGLEILNREGKVTHKLKNDTCQEINHLDFDSETSILRVATSLGVAVFDDKFRQIQSIKEENGLIGENCAHIKHLKAKTIFSTNEGSGNGSPNLFGGNHLTIFSTNKGVTIEEGGVLKSLYVLHGLINNHVYCSEVIDDIIYLGTLGGITVLKDNVVLKSYTTSNSKLSANWITVLLNVDGALYIGTYGGGIDRLDKNGNWTGFYDQIGRFEVNPNAFYYDRPLLFVGTLDEGVFVYNTEKDRWFSLKRGLSSLNITSIIADLQYIYFGTECGITKMPRIEVQRWL